MKSSIFLLIFLAKGCEAQADLVGGQVFDVGRYGSLVAVGVGDASEKVAVELVGGFSAPVCSRGVNSAVPDGVAWAGLR